MHGPSTHYDDSCVAARPVSSADKSTLDIPMTSHHHSFFLVLLFCQPLTASDLESIQLYFFILLCLILHNSLQWTTDAVLGYASTVFSMRSNLVNK